MDQKSIKHYTSMDGFSTFGSMVHKHGQQEGACM